MSEHDLLVVGAGQLGMHVARLWKSSNPSSNVTLKFRSVNIERTKTLQDEGFEVITEEEGELCVAPLVLFSAPPTGNPKYVDDIKKALKENWRNVCFVFTSSGSVFAEIDGGEVTEDSKTKSTERSERLVKGEKEVLNSGGCVLRLGGLYPYSASTMEWYSKQGGNIERPKGIFNQVCFY